MKTPGTQFKLPFYLWWCEMLKTTLIVLLSLSFMGCSIFTKNQRSEDLKEQMQALRQELNKDIKNIIQMDVMPELKGLNYVPKNIRKNQIKAKKSAVEKIVLGRIEWITIGAKNMRLKARVDTGAQTSSLHAENVIEKTIDGKKYVQFESFDAKKKKFIFLEEVIKRSTVRNSDGNTSRRYVIKVRVRLGNKDHEINVNLNNREDLKYNFLIGRNLLMGNYVIDVSQSRLLGQK